MIGGYEWDARAAPGDLAESADHEFGFRVNQVRLEATNDLRHGAVGRR